MASRLARAAAALAVGLSFLVVAAFVAAYAVNFPQWDEWLFTPFLVRVAHGEATLADWLAPHNEHVVLIPRLLLCALAFSVGWDVRFGMVAGLLFASLTLLVLRRLDRTTGPASEPIRLASLVLSAMLVFSLVQWENWLWGMQSAWFLANLCLTVALFAAAPREDGRTGRRGLLALAACGAATLVTAQGPFSFLALLPLAWAGRQNAKGVLRPAWWALMALLAFAFVAASLPAGRAGAEGGDVLREPVRALEFWLLLLAAPFGIGRTATAVIGALAVTAFVWLAVDAWRREGRGRALPWACLGLFSMLVAAATAWARTGHGFEYAYNSRYTTNAILFWIALWHLLAARLAEGSLRRARAVALLAVTLVAIGLVIPSRGAIQNGRLEYRRRWAAKSCIELGARLENTRLNEGCQLYSFLRTGGAGRRWASLVGIGVLAAPPEPLTEATPDSRLGMVDSVTPVSGGRAPIVGGWAAVADRRPPPLLLLSANEGRTFVAAVQLTEGATHQGVVVTPLSTDRLAWQVPLAENDGPVPASPLTAWVFEPRSRTLRRLGGTVSIPGNQRASASVSSPDDANLAQAGDFDGGRGPRCLGRGPAGTGGNDRPSTGGADPDHGSAGDRRDPRRPGLEGRSAAPRRVADLQPVERIVHQPADRSAGGLRRQGALLRVPLHRS